jgi:hypothetical protein
LACLLCFNAKAVLQLSFDAIGAGLANGAAFFGGVMASNSCGKQRKTALNIDL